MTERQPYSIVREHDGFQVRQYPEHVLAQVDVPGGLDSGARFGFGPLFQYISGGNISGQRIAMTAPVVLQPREANSQTVSFVMPTSMRAASAPRPSDPRVRTVAVAPRVVAARRFRGTARAARFTDEGERLLAAVREAGLEPVGGVYYARFDPPGMPGFLRHNEALVELAALPGELSD